MTISSKNVIELFLPLPTPLEQAVLDLVVASRYRDDVRALLGLIRFGVPPIAVASVALPRRAATAALNPVVVCALAEEFPTLCARNLSSYTTFAT